MSAENGKIGALIPLVGKKTISYHLCAGKHWEIPNYSELCWRNNWKKKEFNAQSSKCEVDCWGVCKKPHKSGAFHYHCIVKLAGAKKWISVKNPQNSNMAFKQISSLSMTTIEPYIDMLKKLVMKSCIVWTIPKGFCS